MINRHYESLLAISITHHNNFIIMHHSRPLLLSVLNHAIIEHCQNNGQEHSSHENPGVRLIRKLQDGSGSRASDRIDLVWDHIHRCHLSLSLCRPLKSLAEGLVATQMQCMSVPIRIYHKHVYVIQQHM